MSPALVAALCLLGYVAGYRWYSRWLATRVFRLDPDAVTPAHAQADGVDFVATRPLVLFGHHYASIAGLAPMLGPAVAVFWGWLPALLWVVFGALFVGCVHDFAALVLSARHRGASIGALCESILGPRAKALFLALIFFGISLAMGVFVYIIALLFSWGPDLQAAPDSGRLLLAAAKTSFPEVAMPSAGLMLVAVGAGWLLYKRGKPLGPVAFGGFALLLGLIALGYRFPTLGLERESWPQQAGWTWVLMAYAFAASVLPVWLLLQARDFLNSLLLGMGLLMMYAGFFLQQPDFDAPALNPDPVGAPPILPFVFITIACGAASGFHALVSSGTTARQLDKETHARPVGYGGMIAESLLGLVAVLACTTTFDSGSAWAKLYVNWSAVSDNLGAKLGVFIRGSASFIAELGVPEELAVTLVAMVVVSFALTTLDSATRLLRFNVEEIAGALAATRWGKVCAPLRNRYLATATACASIVFFAFYEIDGRPAGLTLWTLFGGTNQLIAGLALLTAGVYLRQNGRPSWPLLAPAAFMMALTAVALSLKLAGFLRDGLALLAAVAAALLAIGLGVAVTAAAALRRGAASRTPR